MTGSFSIGRETEETCRLLPANSVKLYVYLVCRASPWDTPLVKKGCLFDSLKGLAERSGLSVQEVRTALRKLEISGLILKNQHGFWFDKRRTDIEIKGYVHQHDINTICNTTSTNDQQAINTVDVKVNCEANSLTFLTSKTFMRPRTTTSTEKETPQPPTPASPKGPTPAVATATTAGEYGPAGSAGPGVLATAAKTREDKQTEAYTPRPLHAERCTCELCWKKIHQATVQLTGFEKF